MEAPLCSKARELINRLIVKPTPHNNATPYSCPQLNPSGFFAKPLLLAIQTKPKTPTCLPTNRPRPIPSGTGSSRIEGEIPSSETPALARANTGRMTNPTKWCRSCSSWRSGEDSSEWPFKGNHHGKRNPGKGGMNSGFQYRDPQNYAHQNIAGESFYPEAVSWRTIPAARRQR